MAHLSILLPFAFHFLLCYSSSISHSPSLGYMPALPLLSSRNLQSSSFKLHIKLNSPLYTSSNTVVSLSDPCIVSTVLACVPDPSNTSSSIPNPISIPILNSSPYLEYQFNGYFSNPISLDIYYHNSISFTKDYYSQQNLAGSPTSRTSTTDLNFEGTNTTPSSYKIYGYILVPMSRVVNFSIILDDTAIVNINGGTVYDSRVSTSGSFSYPFLQGGKYYLEIILNDIGGNVKLMITWDIIGVYTSISPDYMRVPNREPGLPFRLNGLKYNTYCDDVSGFRCVVCNGLCVECKADSSMKVCETCKQNASIVGNDCVCDSKFYESVHNPENCMPCDDLCKTCEERDGSQVCLTCTNNASILGNDCVCDPKFYQSVLDPENCMPCDDLCKTCEERDGSQVCLTCTNNASILGNDCICDPKFYQSVLDPENCKSCTGLCDNCTEISGSQFCLTCKEFSRLEASECICIDGYYRPFGEIYPERCFECPLNCLTCEQDIHGMYCTSCKENSYLTDRMCACIDGFYLYDEVYFECRACEGLCKICNNLACNSCVEYAELYDGRCYCIEGYYLSANNPNACEPCMNEHCKTCEEKEGIYECTSCEAPYVLSDSELCICEDQNYDSFDGNCIPKELSLELKSSLNRLELVFNKYLSEDLRYSDINHYIYEKDISSKITVEFIIIEEQLRYAILYNSLYSIETSITVGLSIENSIQDNTNQHLNQNYHEALVPLLFQAPNTADEITINSTSSSETSQSSIESYTDLRDGVKNTIIICVSVVAGLNLANMNMSLLWMLLSTLQIFSFSPLLNINLPSRIMVIAQGMSLNILPNIFELIISYKSKSSPRRYQEMGYDTSSYLINTSELFTILIPNIAFYLLLKIICAIFKGRSFKLQNKIFKIIQGYEYSFFLRFMIQGYLEIGIAASLTLKHLPESYEILDYIVAAISLVIFT